MAASARKAFALRLDPALYAAIERAAAMDLRSANAEIECLLRGQWEDGLVPQIVFHAPSDDYFPGPEVWGIRRDPPTSGITQPPVLATAAHRVLAADATEAGEARMAAIYPRLRDSHRWWAAARDPAGTGPRASRRGGRPLPVRRRRPGRRPATR